MLLYRTIGLAGASGRAVMHFPNNSSVMYEKLPRYVSQP